MLLCREKIEILISDKHRSKSCAQCALCSSPHCVVPCLSMSMMSPHIQDSTAWSVFTFVTWIHLTFCQISESLQFNLTRKPKAADIMISWWGWMRTWVDQNFCLKLELITTGGSIWLSKADKGERGRRRRREGLRTTGTDWSPPSLPAGSPHFPLCCTDKLPSSTSLCKVGRNFRQI